jgi:hypothetical protein
MDRAGVNISEDEAGEDDSESDEHVSAGGPHEDEALTIFRDFINTLDIDDLDTRSN